MNKKIDDGFEQRLFIETHDIIANLLRQKNIEPTPALIMEVLNRDQSLSKINKLAIACARLGDSAAENILTGTCLWSALSNKPWPSYSAISITTSCGVFIGTADQYAFMNRLHGGKAAYCIGCGKLIEVKK